MATDFSSQFDQFPKYSNQVPTFFLFHLSYSPCYFHPYFWPGIDDEVEKVVINAVYVSLIGPFASFSEQLHILNKIKKEKEEEDEEEILLL